MKNSLISSGASLIVIAGFFHHAAAQQTEYRYDELGRLIQTDYNTDKSQKYFYDAAGNRSQVSIGVYDSAGNDAPITIDDARTLNEDNSITISPLNNDVDPDGDTLSLSSVSNPSNGTASKSGNNVIFTPNTNWNGTTSFTYTVSDGSLTDTGSIAVTVNPVNDRPDARNDSRTTNEDTATTFDPRGNDIDVDGQSLTITGKSNGSKGSVAIVNSGTRLRYTPYANQNGSDSFTYTISDGSLTDTATVSVSINAVNDRPNAVNDSYSDVNKTVWTTLSPRNNDTDIDGPNPLKITAASATQGSVQIINSGNNVRFICSTCGTNSFITYTISDGALTDTATITLHLVGGGGGGGLPLF